MRGPGRCWPGSRLCAASVAPKPTSSGAGSRKSGRPDAGGSFAPAGGRGRSCREPTPKTRTRQGAGACLWPKRAGLPARLILATLTRQPPECILWPREPAARQSVAIGRAAFRAPLLLGGQAARAGLSCASCHRNGRGNPHFSFPGLSGAAGTADITSSLMSRMRGDAVFNPKPIPDLAVGPHRISRDPRSDALEDFIRGLVVEEFDGLQPPRAVLKGLGDYVRAMSPSHCRGADQPVRLESGIGRSRRCPASGRIRRSDGRRRKPSAPARRSTLGAGPDRPALSAGRARG